MPEVLTYEALKAERDALADRVKALAVENQAIKAMNDCLSEELRGYESDGAFEGPDMHHLWWKAETPATDAALAAIQAQAKAEAIEQLTIQLEQLPDDAFDVLSDAAEFETYQEEHHTFVSISNPRAVANAVLSLVDEAIRELSTPATDAALAAIEVRALEKFADSEHCSQEAHCYVHLYLSALREAK